MTGKRHPFRIDYEVGFDDTGRIHGIEFVQAADCGILRRSLRRHRRPRDVPCRQRLLSRQRAHHLASLQDEPGVEHRLPRLRRAAGHDGHRAGDGCDRAPPRQGPARDPQAQPLRPGRARRDALPHDRRGQHPAGADRRAGDVIGLLAASPADQRVQCRQPLSQEGPGADAGQVRHLLHHDAPEPGRRAAPRLHRRQRPSESRRHRDGPGPVHQGGAGGGRGAADRSRPHQDHRHQHRQGAEHLGDGRLIRVGHQRHGGARGGADDQGTADRVRGGEVWRGRYRDRIPAPTACASAARRSRSPIW